MTLGSMRELGVRGLDDDSTVRKIQRREQARGPIRKHERRRAKAICVWNKGVRRLAQSFVHRVLVGEGRGSFRDV